MPLPGGRHQGEMTGHAVVSVLRSRPHYPCLPQAAARRSHGSSIMAPFRSMLSSTGSPARPAHARRRARRLQRRPRAGGAGCVQKTAGRIHRQRRRRSAAGRGDRVLRARAARAPAAGLGDPALRQLLAAPGPGIRAAGDALPDLAPGLRRRHRAGDHRAATACRRSSSSPPTASSSSRARRISAGGAAQAADARRLPARHPGGLAGRVQLPRRPDRSVPDGQRPALPHRPVRQRDRQHPHLRRRHPALHLQGQRSAPAAGARVPHRRGRAHPLPPELPRKVRGRPVPQPALQGREQRRVRRRESSTTCRCSSTQPRWSPTTCRRTRWSACTATCRGDRERSGATPARATSCCAATATARCCRRRSCSCCRISSSARSSRSRASRSSPRTATQQTTTAVADGAIAAAAGGPPRRQSAAPAARLSRAHSPAAS